MQYQVPKFIDRETKIFGPISLRQVVVLGAGGAILFALYFIVNFLTFTILAIIISSICVVVAFVEIGGRPISDLLFSIAEYFIKPRLYLWKKEEKEQQQQYNFMQTPNNKGVQPTQPQKQVQQPQKQVQQPDEQNLNKKIVEDLANMLDE